MEMNTERGENFPSFSIKRSCSTVFELIINILLVHYGRLDYRNPVQDSWRSFLCADNV